MERYYRKHLISASCLEQAPNAQKIFDQDQYVYLYDSAQAVYVFDYYGALKNKIPITGWQNFKVAGNIFLVQRIINYFVTISELSRQMNGRCRKNFTGASPLISVLPGYMHLRKDSIEIYSFR